MSLPTRTQTVADTTWPLVSAVALTSSRRKYRAACCEAGSLVRSSGLLAALAFWNVRGAKAAEAHWWTVADHLKISLGTLRVIPLGEPLLEHLRSCDNSTYFQITRQALLVLTWMKRQAEVLITDRAAPPLEERGADSEPSQSFAQRRGLAFSNHAACSNFSLSVHRFPGTLGGDAAANRDAYLRGLLGRRPSQDQDIAFYARALERRRAALLEAGCVVLRVTLTAPLLSGLGARGVREFGFHFSEPWGYPCIPGSSLKGSASAFAHHYGVDGWQRAHLSEEKSALDGSHAAGLFGGRWSEANADSAMGAVCFHDAWWVPSEGKHPFRSRKGDIEARDIITPHHMAWLEGRRPAPDGMEDPVPVPFLNVPRGHSFEFALSGSAEWVGLAKDLLTQAGEIHGVGSKTNLGYGRFRVAPLPAAPAVRPVAAPASIVAASPPPIKERPTVTVQLTELNPKNNKYRAKQLGDGLAAARDKGLATEWPKDATLAIGQVWSAELTSPAYGNQNYRLLQQKS